MKLKSGIEILKIKLFTTKNLTQMGVVFPSREYYSMLST
jgi:hypothetical protein